MYISSVSEVSQENFVRRFQCNIRKRRYFQTNSWEWEFTWN